MDTTMLSMTDTQLPSALMGFTQTPWLDGEPANLIHLINQNGMIATFMDIGATWLSCVLPVKNTQGLIGREVVLRTQTLSEHLAQHAYLGATIGRYANRIKDGRFILGTKLYQLAMNQNGHSLHGGHKGFDKYRWHIANQTSHSVIFTRVSPHAEEGYPGEVRLWVQYDLTEDNVVEIRYEAVSDADTVLNLTNHAYFNLSGIDSLTTALDHQFMLKASHYLPVSTESIPLGYLKSVKGTPFDLRKEGAISCEFDHTFVFNERVTDAKQIVASVLAPTQDVKLIIKTTKPAAQFYTGQYLAGTPGVFGEYQRGSGFAIETQYCPDGPNHPRLAEYGGVLKMGELYQHKTSYGFIF